MATKEQNIINEIIQTSLIKIDGTGDYYNVISSENIFDGFVSENKISRFPALCIVDTDEVKFTAIDSESDHYVSGSSENINDGWPLHIVGFYKKSGSDADLIAKIRELQADIIKAVLADKTRGGLAWNTVLTGVLKNINMGRNKDIGAVACFFSIKYEFEV